jgi:dihydroneopterin aldolase
MTTKIGVYQLAVDAHIGVTEEEQAVAQPLSIDLELTGDIGTDSDQLEETIDYDALARKVIAISQSSRLKLIETLADKVASGLLEEPRVRSVLVRVKKCRPPLAAIQGGFVVEISRKRNDSVS